MALNTSVKLRSVNIYQVFLRQLRGGTFLSLIEELPRIKALGMDYIYLLPIHPIGKTNRKGTLGSPYSIINHKEIDPIYGTIDDFKLLINKAKDLELGIMMDMVFNHTSYDADLYETNSNWYFKENNLPTQKVKDWSDIIDLDHSKDDLQEYLLDVLVYWTNLGVAGFRFDTAPLIPLKFWEKVRYKLKNINSDLLLLGESARLNEVKVLRDKGYNVLSDGELFQVFDVLYDYDAYPEYEAYLKDSTKLNNWLKVVERQESLYPLNYVKLRSLENHDTNRVAFYVHDLNKLLNLTALSGFLKGALMVYAGQEYVCKKTPSLFEEDKVLLDEENLEVKNLLHRISHLRKDLLFQEGIFKIHYQDLEVAVMSYENEMSIAYGIFNLENSKREINISLKDGVYQNILYPNQVKVKDGNIKLTEKPMILFAMKRHI